MCVLANLYNFCLVWLMGVGKQIINFSRKIKAKRLHGSNKNKNKTKKAKTNEQNQKIILETYLDFSLSVFSVISLKGERKLSKNQDVMCALVYWNHWNGTKATLEEVITPSSTITKSKQTNKTI